ncbi:phospholipase DDHD1 isoform X5 [Petaurus breviceps papuanus]|uniref:phospholipase DDHD1 isoform X5 n=1 Tax=Petaurus breviceps papuanus TaxID=3040969 RepID=UPI0036DBB5E8
MSYSDPGSPLSPEPNGRGGGSAWELSSEVVYSSVCCYEHLPGGDPTDAEVTLALLGGDPGLPLAQGLEEHSRHLTLDSCLSDETYDFSSAESGSSLRYYSEGDSCGGGGGGSSSSSLLIPPQAQQSSLHSSISGGAVAATAGPGERKRTRSGCHASRHRYEVVTELGPEEVRWFYKEDKKTWKPFIGYDSLRIELAFRSLIQVTDNRPRALRREPAPASSSGEEDEDSACGYCRSAVLSEPELEELIHIEPVCVRGGLYEVDVAQGECYPVYWNQSDKIPVMRGQWFIDGTWQPLEEEESNLIEQEHLKCFKGQQMQENFDIEVSRPMDGKDDTVDSITPDKVRGLRDMLNSSAMDIMYYTSPLYRDELVKGLQQELNRLYSLFCSRNPDFEEKGGKVSIVSHSLGCVITYDIMTGWNPVRLYEQLVQKESELPDERWTSYEERHLLNELYLTKQRLKEIEERLKGLKTSTITQTPALKFKVENFFCMGSPLAVFLALRGIRPGNSGSQDHILPRIICNRLLNIFHPTDPVAYRLEPLILKHYSNISPVQIHWYNTTNPLPYEHMKPSFLNPAKEPTSASENENLSAVSSPVTSPVMSRRHYGESITNIGKASILGAASIGKGLGGMLFSRFGRSSSSSTSQPSEASKEVTEEEKKPTMPVNATTAAQTFPHSSSGFLDSTLELDHRIDFELREGLVESRYWSAVTSHTAYWSSLDIALFLLTFMYKHEQDNDAKPKLDPI